MMVTRVFVAVALLIGGCGATAALGARDGLVGRPAALRQASLHNRLTDVRVTFGNSKTYKGAYTGSAIARFCGQTDPMQSMIPKTFLLEYPLDLPPGSPVQDVRFSADTLVDGATTTTGFHVSVSVNAPAIGSPPAWAVDTLNPNHHASGTATLTTTGDTLLLTVKATDSLGQTLDVTVTCHPPKP